MSAAIEKIFWLDKSGLSEYGRAARERLYKWVLFERGGKLFVTAMPEDASFVYHMQLMAETARRLGWCDAAGADAFLRRYDSDFSEAGLTILGGGVRLKSGEVRNFSYRFGPVPEKYEKEVLAALGFQI